MTFELKLNIYEQVNTKEAVRLKNYFGKYGHLTHLMAFEEQVERRNTVMCRCEHDGFLNEL